MEIIERQIFTDGNASQIELWCESLTIESNGFEEFLGIWDNEMCQGFTYCDIMSYFFTHFQSRRKIISVAIMMETRM